MLSLRRFLLAGFAALALTSSFGACGPSSGQVKTARTASYKTDANTVFKAVVDVVGRKYKVINADAATGKLRTEDAWYEKDGTSEDKKANDGVMAEDGAIVMYYLVELAGGPDTYQVEVHPMVAQVREGYASPLKLAEDDLAMPGWVHGKTDDLYLAIYESLKLYAVAPAK